VLELLWLDEVEVVELRLVVEVVEDRDELVLELLRLDVVNVLLREVVVVVLRLEVDVRLVVLLETEVGFGGVLAKRIDLIAW